MNVVHVLIFCYHYLHGPLARYVKFRVAYAGNTGNVFPASAGKQSRHASRTCVTHVPWYTPGSLTSGFLWNRWRGKRSRLEKGSRKYLTHPQIFSDGENINKETKYFCRNTSWLSLSVYLHTKKKIILRFIGFTIVATALSFSNCWFDWYIL